MNALLDSALGWTVAMAIGINDCRQILGYASHTRELCRAARLDPISPPAIPEPGSYAMLLARWRQLGFCVACDASGIQEVSAAGTARLAASRMDAAAVPPVRGRVASRAAVSLLLLIALSGAGAQESGRGPRFAAGIEAEFRARSEEAAQRRLLEAARVARTMSSMPAIAVLLDRAHGVYIVPRYGRAALGVGAAGGSGVLMIRRADGQWGNPAFFTMGEIGLGLQAGAQAGPVALLLMNQKAVDSFRGRDNFALDADAGLTVVNYSRVAAGSTAGDVLAWSGGKGLFGNVATLSVKDIRYNRELMQAHYGKPVPVRQVVTKDAPDPRAAALRNALGGRRQAAPE